MLKLTLFALLMNQRGSIGFGANRFYRLMEEEGDKGGGGGAAETEAEKIARLAKEAADKKALDEQDISKLPEWAQKQIKDLRAESAGHRTKNKSLSDRLDKIEQGLKVINGGEDDKSTPEEKLQKLTQGNEGLTVENTILALAVEHGVTKDEMKYFKFLINEKLEALKDDEELSEDQLAEVVKEAKGKSSGTNGKGAANSSVNNGQSGKVDKPNNEVTAEQFKKMGISEKSQLYRKNPELYNKLFSEVGI